MALYRIFRFNREGRFVGAEVADYATDDEALGRAAEMVTDQQGAEVWSHARIVGTLPPSKRSN